MILRGSIIAVLFLSAVVAFIRWHGLSKLPQQWWYPFTVGGGGGSEQSRDKLDFVRA
jgi:hypothetical protein